MYLPRSFKEENTEVLHDMIRRYSFATLYSQGEGEAPMATHLPFMIDSDRGPNGTLIAHMARANSHWKTFTAETEALVVFQGPHAYISPAWYVDQVTVPTWNYAAIHAYGTPRLIDDIGQLREMVEKLVAIHEAGIDPAWDRSQAEAVMDIELKAIMGFEIPISRLEGKFKFNQNRSRKDQERVVEILQGSDDERQREVGELMAQLQGREDSV